MNLHQIDNLVCDTLKQIPKGYSENARLAILMIMAHESGLGHYIRQLKGPALGLIQMEQETHHSLWKYGETCKENAQALGYEDESFERLEYDIRYNILMARQRLFMKPEPIPENGMDISTYLKKHWNSTHGKAGDHSYYRDLNRWISCDGPLRINGANKKKEPD